MKISELSISGPKIIQPDMFHDERGFFREIYGSRAYENITLKHSWVQINHSKSKMNVLRGIHFRNGEAKLVSVVAGTILDIVVDLRANSPTLGKYESVILNQEKQLYIPSGFGHAFLSKSDDTHVVYQTNQQWDPDLAKGIMWNDQDLKIDWGAEGKKFILSEKDLQLPRFKEVLP